MGRITQVISLHLMRIDGVPWNMKDLRPFLGSYPSSDIDSDTEESEQFIYLVLSLPSDSSNTSSSESDTRAPNDPPVSSSSENETHIVPLQSSTQEKRPATGCVSCDQEIRGQCSGDLPR